MNISEGGLNAPRFTQWRGEYFRTVRINIVRCVWLMRLLLATAANGKVLYFKTPDDFFLFLQRRFKYQDTTNLAMCASSRGRGAGGPSSGQAA